jgi:hypothetical protein
MKIRTNVKAGASFEVSFKATTDVSVKSSAEASVKVTT